jgi:hypothetical protein
LPEGLVYPYKILKVAGAHYSPPKKLTSMASQFFFQNPMADAPPYCITNIVVFFLSLAFSANALSFSFDSPVKSRFLSLVSALS